MPPKALSCVSRGSPSAAQSGDAVADERMLGRIDSPLRRLHAHEPRSCSRHSGEPSVAKDRISACSPKSGVVLVGSRVAVPPDFLNTQPPHPSTTVTGIPFIGLITH